MIKFHSISLSRGKKLVFQNFSANIAESEIIFITGSNGSGKTSFLKIIAKLLLPSKGKITLTQKDTPISEVIQPYCIYISHKNYLRMEFTVLENVKFWSQIYQTEFLLDSAIKYFKISEITNMECTKLSLGNLRKINILRLYLANTPICLLDEIEVHLDKENLALLCNLIKMKSRSGKIIFIATNAKPYLRYHRHLEISDCTIRKIDN